MFGCYYGHLLGQGSIKSFNQPIESWVFAAMYDKLGSQDPHHSPLHSQREVRYLISVNDV